MISPTLSGIKQPFLVLMICEPGTWEVSAGHSPSESLAQL